MKIDGERKKLCFAADTKQAREIQRSMQPLLERRALVKFREVELIAGCDVSYSIPLFPPFSKGDVRGIFIKGGERGISKAAITVYSRKKKKFIEDVVVSVPTGFPYIPTFLTFREAPAVIPALEKLKHRPDIFIFDGQGICHPLRLGLAAHMGIVLRIPSVGCAKSHLYGIYEEPPDIKGAYTFIKEKSGEILGVCLRTRKKVKPLFVSPGWGVDILLIIDVVMETAGKYKLPEIMRRADKLSKNGGVYD